MHDEPKSSAALPHLERLPPGHRFHWRDNELLVTASLVPRRLWTTASIDVYVNGHVALRTLGQAKATGTVISKFSVDGEAHELSLEWGVALAFTFPCIIRVDGNEVERCDVPVRNSAMLLVAPVGFIGGTFAFTALMDWLTR